jgi:Annexin
MKGAGTDEEALIEILASRSTKRLQDIQNLYSTCKTNANIDEKICVFFSSLNFYLLVDRSIELTRLFLSLVFNRTLTKDVASDTSGHLKNILLALLAGQRPNTNEVNETDVNNDARILFEAGEKKWGTDESKFVEIISRRR